MEERIVGRVGQVGSCLLWSTAIVADDDMSVWSETTYQERIRARISEVGCIAALVLDPRPDADGVHHSQVYCVRISSMMPRGTFDVSIPRIDHVPFWAGRTSTCEGSIRCKNEAYRSRLSIFVWMLIRRTNMVWGLIHRPDEERNGFVWWYITGWWPRETQRFGPNQKWMWYLSVRSGERLKGG